MSVRPTGYCGLDALCSSLGVELPALEIDNNDEVARTKSITASDVVISTVGPFLTLGRAVARSATRAGARYLDSTGEPPFVHWMFNELDPIAKSSGAVLIPAFGYDYVPGNLAGALAITRADGEARHVAIGYFLVPGTDGHDRRASLRAPRVGHPARSVSPCDATAEHRVRRSPPARPPRRPAVRG